MGTLNDTPSGERLKIGFFGIRNAGKSSICNAITGQNLSLVSDFKGTTTDPVKKAMEILPLGPVVIIDTPGIDDTGKLGELRVNKAMKTLKEVDIAVIVIDGTIGFQSADKLLVETLKNEKTPFLIALNKWDLIKENKDKNLYIPKELENLTIKVSANTGKNIPLLKERLGDLCQNEDKNKKLPLVSDLLNERDTVILIMPIDESAPKGRIILPEQAVIRDLLDNHILTICIQPEEIENILKKLDYDPDLIITDSGAFKTVMEKVPERIPVTSFSIIFSRYKGNLEKQLKAISTLNSLENGDAILIAEGCTHHRQCNDLGYVKIPGWIEEYTSRKLNFYFSSGNGFPDDLTKFRMVIHCGGCMLSEKVMKERLKQAENQNVPVANYGMLIAETQGILDRALKPFKKTGGHND